MRWQRKKKKDDSADRLGIMSEMTPEEHMVAAENVMTCRDAFGLFMALIHEHRSDGHECLPYCIPAELHEQLEGLDIYELKMILTVVLKDLYNAHVYRQMEQP